MADAPFHPLGEFFDDGTPPTKTKSAKAARRLAAKAEKEERQLLRTPKPLIPRNAKQAAYIEAITENELTFGIGPAGVGKTYVAARIFGEWLAAGKIGKIFAARPPVAKAKHKMGFLPGDQKEKSEPWLVPIYEGIKDALGPSAFENAKKNGLIEIVPFEFIQGRTLRAETGSTKGAACIVDEAENLDLDDLYITLTRQGDGLHMVMCGDVNQARIPNSGLADVVQMAQEDDHESSAVIVFTEDEVVRSRQAAQWVKSFAKRPHLLGFKHRDDRLAGLKHGEFGDMMASETDTSTLPGFITGNVRHPV